MSFPNQVCGLPKGARTARLGLPADLLRPRGERRWSGHLYRHALFRASRPVAIQGK